MLYLAIYWLFSALLFLNSPRVNYQVQAAIFRGIVNHINKGELKGASFSDIERISNNLSLIFTFMIVIMAPFILTLNLFLLTLQLLKSLFSGLLKKDKSE